MTTDAGLAGVYVAAVTPFRDEGLVIDLEAYLAHLRWLVAAGVDGIVCFGTNGEGPSTSADEQWSAMRSVLAAGLEVPVVATVTAANLPDTLMQVRRLDALPLAGVLVLPPHFFQPVEDVGLRAFYERVVAVTRHPVIAYHVPKYALAVPASLVVDLPMWGAKDSGGDAAYTEQVLAGGRGVLLGTEGAIREGLARGAQGLVSALANVVPEWVVSLTAAVEDGRDEEAAEIEAALLRLRAHTKQYASPGVLKRLATARHGHPLGTVRPPLVPLPAAYDPAQGLAEVGLTDETSTTTRGRRR